MDPKRPQDRVGIHPPPPNGDNHDLLGTLNQNLDGELLAIAKAMEPCTPQYSKALILSDSPSAIQITMAPIKGLRSPEFSIEGAILREASLLQEGSEIAWVPAHSSIIGNE